MSTANTVDPDHLPTSRRVRGRSRRPLATRSYGRRSSAAMLMAFLVIALISLAGWTSAATIIPSSSELSYCKCICFSNSTIVPLYNPTNPSQPCLSCTRQFCLDQKLPICRGAELPDLDTDTATERDSPRDQYIVTLFLLIVFGLLLTASIRNRLEKAIEERGGRPTDLRQWGEALIPPSILPLAQDSTSGARQNRRGGAGGGVGGIGGWMQDKYYRHFSGGRGTTSGGDGGSSGGGGGGQYDRL